MRQCGKTVSFIFAVALAAINGSCVQPGPDAGQVTEIQRLRDELDSQRRLLATKDEHIQAQATRIQELQGLAGERSIEQLVHVARIELASLSGGYDDDRDGIDDGVVVYIKQIDQDGDIIKAAGSCQVRVLDLANPPESQCIGEVKLASAELRKLWYGRFMTSHFTVKVPWANGMKSPAHKTLTVIVRWTDLLSGEAFELQTAVAIAGAMPPK